MKNLIGWLFVVSAVVLFANESLANQPPTATFTSWPRGWAYTNQSVVFDGTQSKDYDGWIIAYEWDFNGDGWPDRFGPQTEWSFSLPGDYFVTLLVRDNWGAIGVSFQKFKVIQSNLTPTPSPPPVVYQPPPVIVSPPPAPSPIIVNLEKLSEKDKAIVTGLILGLVAIAILIKAIT
jgi:hypothetical protein